MKGNIYLATFFLLLGLFGVVYSLTFDYWESIVMPLAISGTIFLLATFNLVKEIRFQYKKETTLKQESLENFKNNLEIRRFVLVFGWCAGFALAIYLLGFYIAIPLFIFTYSKWRKRRWRTAIVFSLAVSLITYFLFHVGLKAQLYEGLIFNNLTP